MICVICGSNVNVMIELGLRLMTDKPVLVIYEENTRPPFDVNVLEMFSIPLNPDYKDYQTLKEEIKQTLPKMLAKNYKTFLSNFKTIAPKGISGTEHVELSKFMNETKESIQNLQTQFALLTAQRDSVELVKEKSRSPSAGRIIQRERNIPEGELSLQFYKYRLSDLKMRTEEIKANNPVDAKKKLASLLEE